MRTPFLLSFSLLIVAGFPARGAEIYNNITTFQGSGLQVGGATAVGANDINNVIADDITPAAGAVAAEVTGIDLSIANFNSTSVMFQPIVSIWAADGAGGGPGTLITVLAFSTITQAAGSNVLYGASNISGFFVTPSRFWVGISFDDAQGSLSITAAQLNHLGQGVYGPPTIGSSLDQVFVGSTPGQESGDNPSGVITNFGGSPAADFGWEFSGTLLATPEPASGIFVAAGGLAMAALLSKRRRTQ